MTFFKVFLTIAFISFTPHFVKAQILTGQWDGYYLHESSGKNFDQKIRISLRFILNTDSTYKIYSNTYIAGASIQAKMTYCFPEQNSLVLEENNITKSNQLNSFCRQKIYLRMIRAEDDDRHFIWILGRYRSWLWQREGLF